MSAAEDASEAVRLQPSWGKGHVRLAQALEKLEQWESATAAAEAALALEPQNAFVSEIVTRTARAHFHFCTKLPLTTGADFLRAFRVCRDARLRLATLATFWNQCSQEERHSVFAALLPAVQASGLAAAVSGSTDPLPPSAAQVGGCSQPHEPASSGSQRPEHTDAPSVALQSLRLEDVPSSAMIALPMHNYADVALPSEWLHWFKQLTSQQRAAVFNDAWGACSPEECLLVAGDMLHFLQQGAMLTAAAAGAGDAGSQHAPGSLEQGIEALSGATKG